MNNTRPSVLYIHGFESSPRATKTSIIADLGYLVVAPQLHYQEVMGSYGRLKQLAREFEVDWLIGSSLGGYMAFWLSQELQVPTLLFNPALPFSEEDPGLIKEKPEINNYNQNIFLGLKDEKVDPILTKSWLKKRNLIHHLDFIEHPTNAHEIPLDVFQETISSVSEKLELL